jgi:hypothetical protein
VTAELCGRSAQLPLMVMAANGPSLLGRQWFAPMKIQPPTVAANVYQQAESEQHITELPPLEKLHTSAEPPADIANLGTNLFETSLGCHTGPSVHIHMRADAVPRFRCARPVALAVRQQATQAVESLVGTVLRPASHSEWASPAVYVVKPNGEVRFCIDYSSTVNAHCNRDVYPLPSVDEILSHLSGSNFFSKLDLKDAFLQLTLDEETSKLLTVNTHKGLYNVLRMPPGLSSAPAIFQKTIESHFSDLDWVVIYLDDMFITAQSEALIWQRTREVMCRLIELGFRLRRDKCLFAVRVLPMIGYVVSGSGVRPSGDKVRPIVHARSPANREELQVYLGAINYYDRFFANKAHHFSPLYRLLRTDVGWQWTESEERSIQHVRNIISSGLVLCSFQVDLPLYLATDACQHGIGCVLSHVIDGIERLIMYGSRSLTQAETKYSVTDLEATAVVFGLKKCRFYCAGRKGLVIVDHKPLTGIFRRAGKPIPDVLSPRILRLCLEAAAFDYENMYREGKKHANADFCSRFPVDPAPQIEAEEPAVVMFLSSNPTCHSILAQEIARATAEDDILSQVARAIQRGTPKQKLPPAVRSYIVGPPGALTVSSGCILFGSRVFIPVSL